MNTSQAARQHQKQVTEREKIEIAIKKAHQQMSTQDNVKVVFPPTENKSGYTLICTRKYAKRKKYNFTEL
jgi:hypothetical protein